MNLISELFWPIWGFPEFKSIPFMRNLVGTGEVLHEDGKSMSRLTADFNPRGTATLLADRSLMMSPTISQERKLQLISPWTRVHRSIFRGRVSVYFSVMVTSVVLAFLRVAAASKVQGAGPPLSTGWPLRYYFVKSPGSQAATHRSPLSSRQSLRLQGRETRCPDQFSRGQVLQAVVQTVETASLETGGVRGEEGWILMEKLLSLL